MEKKLLLSLLIIVCFAGVSFSQTYSNLTTDNEVHSFIKLNKRVFKKNRIDSRILDWSKCNLFEDPNNCWRGDFLQTENDSIISGHYLNNFQTIYNSLNINQKLFLNFSDRQEKNQYTRISIPLISSDGTIAIVKISHWCGDECGSGGILVFKRIRNKWIKVDYRCTWIS